MIIAKEVKQKILQTEEGTVITYDDFAYLQNFNAVSLVLSRLVKEGVIKRLEKGKYYRPVQSKFGGRGPSESQIVKGLSDEGYVSGNAAYNKLGLTNQISNKVIIIGKKYNRTTKVGNLRIKYQKRDGRFNNKNKKYFQILDAIKDIKKIAGSNVNQSLEKLLSLIKNMEANEQNRLLKYAETYKPMVRAVLGAILEQLGNPLSQNLKQTLNPLTKYDLGIDTSSLPNKESWRIK